MDMNFSTFDYVGWQGDSATHPLARQIMRLPLHPQGAGRIRNATHAATTPLSFVVAGMSLLPTRKGRAAAVKPLKRQQQRSPRFGLKDSDPLRAKARVESYAASARPDVPSGASSYGS
jgi:hypothetical protein